MDHGSFFSEATLIEIGVYLISSFVEDVAEHKTTTFFSFSGTSIQSFRIQLQKKMATFDEMNEMG